MISYPIRIAIVGAGPAGLTLGVLLHRQDIPFTIFELRQRPTPVELDGPAGSLDLHDDSGLAAIRECGLLEELSSFTGDCTEAQKLANKYGDIIYSDEGEASNRPEISRNKLQNLLLAQLPPDSIKWGHKLHSCKKVTVEGRDNEVKLDFGNHDTRTFDLVVGADGAWSKVRDMLTEERPKYAGFHSITLNIRHISAKYPDLANLVGHGTFNALADHHMVASQHSVSDSVRIYVMISTVDKHFASTSGLDSLTPSQAKSVLVNTDSLFQQWGTNIKHLISVACDDESATYPCSTLDIKALHTLPPGHTWTHQAGVTLIGDAAHLTNPPAGEGVNIGMQDALVLAQAIRTARESAAANSYSMQKLLDGLIVEFEAGMALRAKDVAEFSTKLSRLMFGTEDGAGELARWFVEAGAAAGAAGDAME